MFRNFASLAASALIVLTVPLGEAKPPRSMKPPPGLASGEAARSPRGIFLYDEDPTSDPLYAEAVGAKGIDGLAVVVNWADIASGRDTLTPQLQAAKAHDLPIELVVRAGIYSAQGLPNLQYFKFSWTAHKGVGGCQEISMPAPWEPGYISAFEASLKTAAKAVGSSGVKLVAVKLTGINTATEELRLPAQGDDKCPINDDTTWTGAGYSKENLETAFSNLIGVFAKLFPNTPITVAEIPRGAFPPPGKITVNNMLYEMIGGAARALPGRMILQFDFLMYDQAANAAVIQMAHQYGLPLAWQTNLWGIRNKLGAAACGGTSPLDATACTDEQFFGLLEEGIHPKNADGLQAQALYIEVFPYDVIHHAAAVVKAHDELLAPPPVPPHPIQPSPRCAPGVRCPKPI